MATVNTLVAMLYILIIINLIFPSQIMALWNCGEKGEKGEKGGIPNIISYSFKLHYLVLCNIARCDRAQISSIARFYGDEYYDHGSKYFELEGLGEKGVKASDPDLYSKYYTEKTLRKAIAEKYILFSNYLEYLGQHEHDKLFKYKLAKRPTYFFTFHLYCVQEKYEIEVYPSPVPFTFPEIGNCIPNVHYLPVEKKRKDFYKVSDGGIYFRFRKPGIAWAPNNISAYPPDLHESILSYFIYDYQYEKTDFKAKWESYRDQLINRLDQIQINSSLEFDWPSAAKQWLETYTIFSSPYDLAKPFHDTKLGKVFQMVVTCGHYTIYTDIHLTRKYDKENDDLSYGQCVEKDDAKKGTIEECSVCPDLNCPQVSVQEFLKNRPYSQLIDKVVVQEY